MFNNNLEYSFCSSMPDITHFRIQSEDPCPTSQDAQTAQNYWEHTSCESDPNVAAHGAFRVAWVGNITHRLAEVFVVYTSSTQCGGDIIGAGVLSAVESWDADDDCLSLLPLTVLTALKVGD
jgi:hypothetical protein